MKPQILFLNHEKTTTKTKVQKYKLRDIWPLNILNALLIKSCDRQRFFFFRSKTPKVTQNLPMKLNEKIILLK